MNSWRIYEKWIKKGVDYGKIKNLTNELVIYFDEDLFNDVGYDVGGVKREELAAQIKNVINKHLPDL